jgi:hypothetical protein
MEDMMTGKMDKGRSVLNATDETANPYGLILSEEERNYIYGKLSTIEHKTNSLHDARTGWRPHLKSALLSALELAIIALVVGLPASLVHGPSILKFTAFNAAVAFLILQKLNLLLTHETIDQIFARQDREDKKEAAERARHFKDMRCRDMSLVDDANRPV